MTIPEPKEDHILGSVIDPVLRALVKKDRLSAVLFYAGTITFGLLLFWTVIMVPNPGASLVRAWDVIPFIWWLIIEVILSCLLVILLIFLDIRKKYFLSKGLLDAAHNNKESTK